MINIVLVVQLIINIFVYVNHKIMKALDLHCAKIKAQHNILHTDPNILNPSRKDIIQSPQSVLILL
jgi:hypothetical protein